jgi:hypothetical protein
VKKTKSELSGLGEAKTVAESVVVSKAVVGTGKAKKQTAKKATSGRERQRPKKKVGPGNASYGNTPRGIVATVQQVAMEAEEKTGPGELKSFSKKKAAEAWPLIMSQMVKKAQRGSVTHAKFLVDVSGLKDEKSLGPNEAGPSFSQVLKGHLRKKQVVVGEVEEKVVVDEKKEDGLE